MFQRELTGRIGLSNKAINDLERDNIQKPAIDILINFFEELDISIKLNNRW